MKADLLKVRAHPGAATSALARHSLNWGDVPSWIAAIATVLGLAAAGIAAWYVRGQVKAMREQLVLMRNQEKRDRVRAAQDRKDIARQRDKAAEDDRIRARALAQQIDLVREKYSIALQGINTEIYWVATVRNNSDRPIRNLRCAANVQGEDLPSQALYEYFGHIKPYNIMGDPAFQTSRFEQDRGLRPPLVLRRGDEISFVVPVATSEAPNTRYWAQFQDDADLWWWLDSDQRLRSITPGELFS